jgi:GT2 family glycosyltransferase
MYDGYARGFARSGGEIVVFSHDDIRFAVPDFAARLAGAMRELDMAGVAGTTRVIAPSLLGSGHPHLFGTITHAMEGAGSLEFSVLSLQGPRIGGAQGLDGVFIAARRELAERLGFDAARFDGFHFYDLDFSYRAHLAGARVGIAADLGLIHDSRGAADKRWRAAQRAFADKFSLAADAPPAPAHWYAVRLADATAVSEMYAKLFAAWALPLGVSV